MLVFFRGTCLLIFAGLLLGCSLTPEQIDDTGLAERPSPKPMVVQSPPDCQGLIWQSNVAGTSYKWTTDEIRVGPKGDPLVLFRPSFLSLHSAQMADAKANMRAITSTFGDGRKSHLFKSTAVVNVLSIVGPFVTFGIDHESFLDGYSRSHESWWLSVDLTDRRHVLPFSDTDVENYVSTTADLSRIFPHLDLYDALTKNPQVQAALAGPNGQKNGLALKDLIANENEESRVQVSKDQFLTSYSFEHFVFSDSENGTVNIKLALVSPAVTNTYDVDFLEIQLNVPDTVTGQIQRADHGIEGFLSRDQNLVSNGCSTLLEQETTFR